MVFRALNLPKFSLFLLQILVQELQTLVFKAQVSSIVSKHNCLGNEKLGKHNEHTVSERVTGVWIQASW